MYLEWMLAHPWASLLIYLGLTAWMGIGLSFAEMVLMAVSRRKGGEK